MREENQLLKRIVSYLEDEKIEDTEEKVTRIKQRAKEVSERRKKNVEALLKVFNHYLLSLYFLQNLLLSPPFYRSTDR